MSAVSALTVVRRASRKFIMETPRAMTTLRHFSDGSSPEAKLSSPKLQELYGDITKLREEDVNMLGAIVLKMLGRKLFPGEFGRGLEGLEFAAAPVLEEEEEKEEQTAFAVKLMGKTDVYLTLVGSAVVARSCSLVFMYIYVFF